MKIYCTKREHVILYNKMLKIDKHIESANGRCEETELIFSFNLYSFIIIKTNPVNN